MSDCSYILTPLGDSAISVFFTDQIDPHINQIIHQNVDLLAYQMAPGIVEITPAYGSLTVQYDPLLATYSDIEHWLREHLTTAEAQTVHQPHVIHLPTIYGGEYGPDLDFVASHANLTPVEVIRLHAEREYPVYMMGFTPGFPYLGGLNPAIATPRLKVPRTQIRPGSVGIANTQTGVYSVASPGGWQLIGWTPAVLFDVNRESPCLITPGDLIKFDPIRAEEADRAG